uniref:BLS3D n=1 Tax=Schmidtea mediterranea TaxID=79327 RepID=A0A6F9F3T2_SCHMD|nr:TPA_exp: BLS3D [Schmidtea mediterranea]
MHVCEWFCGSQTFDGTEIECGGLIKADLGLRLGLYLGAGYYRSVLEIPAINHFLIGLRARVSGPIYANVQAHLEDIGKISSGIYGLGIDREKINRLVYQIRKLERRRYELEALRRTHFPDQDVNKVFEKCCVEVVEESSNAK